MSINFSEDVNDEIITTAASLPEDNSEGSLRPKTIEEYIRDSRYNYVILSNANQPEHWLDCELDETNWVVYGSREEAEDERQLLISEKDFGHRVVTERYFLKMKGLV